ncbi:single-stranded DNA-binding protein [Oceanobacillus timonensis]|uniref:single-stranded DNA-binding protein n=1 Tax=Oceanobacillus timonensis TaxID=1926285 RepID=UPI0009B9E0D4|nr:single-stranded DNA-binding protein [Oceanobacillus timonensis]
MNNVNLIGRLTKDVDLRYTSNGVAVANFSIAVNRPFSNQQGNNDADFFNCVVWRRIAENTANYCKKGSQVGISGRLQSRSFDGQDGKKVYITEVVAENVQFLDTRNGNDNNKQKEQNKSDLQNNQSNSSNENGEPVDIDNDDLPF